MTLADQAARRVDLARRLGAQPRRWIATAAAAASLPVAGGVLHGVPLAIGTPRSEWGLDLEVAPRHG